MRIFEGSAGIPCSFLLVFHGLSCGGSGAPPAEDPRAAQATAPASGATFNDPSSEGDVTGSAPAGAEQTSASSTPAVPTPFEVCGQMCDRMAQRCSESAAKSCRLNCKQYQSPKAGCDDHARAALECARDAKDLQCAAIAPMSCNPAFLRFAACTRGEKVEVVAEKATGPEGWEKFSAKSAGFTALMPRGVSEKAEGGEPVFSVTDGSVTYSVRMKKAPDQKPTQKSLVKVALDMLGVKCSKNLRLHGMIETAQSTSIRFDSECKDGVQWRGQFVVTGGKLFVLAVTGPEAVKAEREAFFSGFVPG